jgi:hypothetical protein
VGEALQDYKLLSTFKEKWIVAKKCSKKQKNQKPKSRQGKWSNKEQEDNNKQKDHANSTMWEMNMIQVDCCKKNIYPKKNENPNNKREMNK